MPSQDALVEFLKEHISYELLMLRHAYDRLRITTNTLDWNMAFEAFEAFGIHARLLHKFLKGTDGNQNIAAELYVQFQILRQNELAGVLQKFDPQIFHLGKQRIVQKKANIADVNRVKSWIEDNIKQFIDALPEPYRGRGTLNILTRLKWRPFWKQATHRSKARIQCLLECCLPIKPIRQADKRLS